MVRFIDQRRVRFGVELICRVLQIAPSLYDLHKLWERAPECRPKRGRRDAELRDHIQRAWDDNFDCRRSSRGAVLIKIKTKLRAAVLLGMSLELTPAGSKPRD